MADSIPIVKIRDILLVTMPADPADAAISQFQESITQQMARWNPNGVVVDLSVVAALDSFFARTLVETGSMVRLMGGRMVVCGMSPPVAITLIQLGLTLGRLETALDVDRALDLLGALNSESATEAGQ